MNRQPFPAAVNELLSEREWSQEELAKQTARKGSRIARPTLSVALRGELYPTRRMMGACAKAFGVRPEHFPEFRMAAERDKLDPRVVGFKKALARLEDLES